MIKHEKMTQNEANGKTENSSENLLFIVLVLIVRSAAVFDFVDCGLLSKL